MKSKLRNITVREQSFVYWYLSGQTFVLNISPKEDKTSKITLIFRGTAPIKDPITFWAFYDLRALKDNAETFIGLTRPKCIAEIISFLLDHIDNPLKKGRVTVINNAFDLFNGMGYTNINPVWIREC